MSSQTLADRTRDGRKQAPLRRAEEVDKLLTSVKDLIVPFINAADEDAETLPSSHGLQQPGGGPRSVLVEHHPPQKLSQLLNFTLPAEPQGLSGLRSTTSQILQYSVNTWSQGFLDKLYASPTPPGLAAELLLSALNTNVHVYSVAPALTVIEKTTCAALARLFGLTGPHAGGISQPGGSAANLTALAIARNSLFPETKAEGNGARKFVVITSAHGHYSVEKAAQMLGLGAKAVRSVDVDAKGRMVPAKLEEAVERAKSEGETPFFVNATAGTTVLGSFDPLEEISSVCRKHGLWLHVDGSWGGSVVFSEKQKIKLRGVEKADSVAICAHKMLNVPLTCSFLLGKDLREFQKAMTLPAGYLFHNAADEAGGDAQQEVWDLADLTPQCGRRGDSLKLALTWIYYGADGLGSYVDHAFETTGHLTSLLKANSKFSLVSDDPPPCLQVCFYFDKKSGEGHQEANSHTTEEIAKALVPRGFMADYAPGEAGKFFRVVVNGQTRRETVEGLVKAIEEVGGRLKK